MLLREDNADIRLTPIAHELGLIDEARWARFNQKMENIEQERQRLRSIWLHPRSEYLEEANKVLGSPLVREANGEDLLRRPEITYDILTSLTPYKPAMEDREAVEQVEIAIKYQGYIEHQQEEIEKQNATKIQLSRLTLITAKCLVYLMKYVRSWNSIVRFPLVKRAEFQALLLRSISNYSGEFEKTRHAKTWGVNFSGIESKSAVNFHRTFLYYKLKRCN